MADYPVGPHVNADFGLEHLAGSEAVVPTSVTLSLLTLERFCRFVHPPCFLKDEPIINSRFGFGLRASTCDVGHTELHDHTVVSRLVGCLDVVVCA